MNYVSARAFPVRKSVEIDSFTLSKIRHILALKKAHPGLSKGAMIALISRQFLGLPYVDNRLVGSATTPERLVADFRALDCFTYLDYVEALRHATTLQGFVQNLIRTRYADGQVSFLKRKHFFSDWAYRSPTLARDVTAAVSSHAVSVVKILNRKSLFSSYIAGLPDVKRTITYIPSQYVDRGTLRRLRTGDYIGIYDDGPGQDVTHVGIYVVTKDGPQLRNASSLKANRKVVDSPFLEYVRTKPGIVVYRPR